MSRVFLVGLGYSGRRTAPVGAPGDSSAEPDLCASAEEAGLNKILRYAIIENRETMPSYSEERQEAAWKFARKYHSAERFRMNGRVS